MWPGTSAGTQSSADTHMKRIVYQAYVKKSKIPITTTNTLKKARKAAATCAGEIIIHRVTTITETVLPHEVR